jgi:4-amino-4-deoxy-L-arabinose transferase-like glycosyltransferase
MNYWQRSFLSRKIVFAFVVSVSLARILYAIFIIDPNSGQDAPSYSADATSVLSDGFFAPLSFAPTWPIGYTWFISVIWSIFGIYSRWLGVIQCLLVALASYSIFRLARREFDERVATIALVLFASSPAIFVSSGEIMYEMSSMCFLVIATDLLSQFIRGVNKSKTSLLVGTILLFLAALIHPSILPVSLIILLSIFLRFGTKLRRRYLYVTILVAAILMAPALTMVRNVAAGDGLGYTRSAAMNMLAAGWGQNRSSERDTCLEQGNQNWDDARRSMCLIIVTSKDPIYLGEVLLKNTNRWVSPYIGIMKGNGTWYHGLDWRRIFTWYTWWDGPWKVFDFILCYIWISISVGLFLLGLSTFRSSPKWANKYELAAYQLFLAPIATAFLVSLFTFGDSRHRLIVSPFIIVFYALGIQKILDSKKLKLRKNSRDS